MFHIPLSFQAAAAGFAPCSQSGTLLPIATLRLPEGWREGEGLAPKEGSPQQITHRCTTTLIGDTNGLSYSNHGNWEAASFNRSPILILPTCGIHVQVLPTVRKKKEGKKGYCCFPQKTPFSAIALKKAILHHGYLYTYTSFGKIFQTQNQQTSKYYQK